MSVFRSKYRVRQDVGVVLEDSLGVTIVSEDDLGVKLCVVLEGPGVAVTMSVLGRMSVTSGRFGSVRSPGPKTVMSRLIYSCTLY